jgi:hypothetical protein
MTTALRASIAAAILLGAVMTFGDFVWATWHVRHRAAYGIAHGALMCLCIGAVIGWRERRLGAGALAGPVIGVAAAVAFYLLAPLFRMGAMLPAWMLFWILFALLQQRLASGEPLARALGRGAAAAVLSGGMFYLISGIWTRPSPGGPDYLVHFASWSAAFLPGFLALFVPAPVETRRAR